MTTNHDYETTGLRDPGAHCLPHFLPRLFKSNGVAKEQHPDIPSPPDSPAQSPQSLNSPQSPRFDPFYAEKLEASELTLALGVIASARRMDDFLKELAKKQQEEAEKQKGRPLTPAERAMMTPATFAESLGHFMNKDHYLERWAYEGILGDALTFIRERVVLGSLGVNPGKSKPAAKGGSPKAKSRAKSRLNARRSTKRHRDKPKRQRSRSLVRG